MECTHKQPGVREARRGGSERQEERVGSAWGQARRSCACILEVTPPGNLAVMDTSGPSSLCLVYRVPWPQEPAVAVFALRGWSGSRVACPPSTHVTGAFTPRSVTEGARPYIQATEWEQNGC